MRFSNEAYYRVICARDSHFDGQFVRASRKLKIYCRPTCATPVPKFDNCVFFASAALAQQQGYRPCRRCRSDALPTAARWAGTATTTARALRLIANGALDETSVDKLASRVGVTDRHLRRLFKQHLGCSPVSIAIAHRLAVARRIIEETSQPIIQVAHEAGFSSVRRFNDAFRKAYPFCPSDIRSDPLRPVASPSEVYELRLGYHAPYDWAQVRQSLAARAVPEVEYIGEKIYQRAVEIGGRVGLVTVRFWPNRPYVSVTISQLKITDLPVVIRSIREVLDLNTDPAAAGRCLGVSPDFPSHAAASGVRVIGWWDNLEGMLGAILAAHLGPGWRSAFHAVVTRSGMPLTLRGAGVHVVRACPGAEALSGARSVLDAIGLPTDTVKTIVTLAQRVSDGTLSLHPAQCPDGFRKTLMEIDGIGADLAEIITQNILERGDALSAADWDDLRAARQDTASDAARPIQDLVEGWRPWRAYGVAMLRQARAIPVPARTPAIAKPATPLLALVEAELTDAVCEPSVPAGHPRAPAAASGILLRTPVRRAVRSLGVADGL